MKIVYFSIVLAFISGCGKPGALIDRPVARERIVQAAPIIEAIEEYRISKGMYPAAIIDVSLPHAEASAVDQKKFFYEKTSQDRFGLSFRFDDGFNKPICTYWSDESRWQCLMK